MDDISFVPVASNIIIPLASSSSLLLFSDNSHIHINRGIEMANNFFLKLLSIPGF